MASSRNQKKLQVVKAVPEADAPLTRMPLGVAERIIGGEDCRKRTELGPNALAALRKIDAFAKAEADTLRAAEHRRQNYAENGRTVH